MSRPFQPVKPADIEWQQGSPYAKLFDDIYYSRENGLAESYHVFITGNDLISRWQQLPERHSFVIAETGFGTGLNFLLTMQLWHQLRPKNANLFYYACEKHPLTLSDLKCALSSWPDLKPYAAELIEQYPTLTPGFHNITFSNGIRLTLIFEDAETAFNQMLPGCAGKIDSWFLDGFAPSKNQSMWSPHLFNLISALSHQHTQLATFTCARIVKDGLLQAGFFFEKVKGYGQKREMLKAVMIKPNTNLRALKKGSFWQFGHHHPVQHRHVIVLGAGLAGCLLANQLASLGWTITLVDKASQPGMGASGNPKAVIFPNFSAYASPLSQLMLQAYPHAIKFYQNMNLNQVEHQLNGMINVEDEPLSSAIIEQWFKQISKFVKPLTENELSNIAGVKLTSSGLWFPHSGWINSKQLCLRLLEHPKINFIGNKDIDNFSQYEGKWQVADMIADVLILANGWQMKQYTQTQFLPLRAIKGQMTAIPASSQSSMLQVPVCGGGHVLPADGGRHYLGATYHIDMIDNLPCAEDDIENLRALNDLPLKCEWSDQITAHWSGIRTTTNDYLPIVGAIPNQKKFLDNFKGLAKDANRVIENLDPFEPNLYAFTGFGSKGLTTIPLCASYLASLIANSPINIPESLISALAPARFLHRNIIKRKT